MAQIRHDRVAIHGDFDAAAEARGSCRRHGGDDDDDDKVQTVTKSGKFKIRLSLV
jgi:hypothetical protein